MVIGHILEAALTEFVTVASGAMIMNLGQHSQCKLLFLPLVVETVTANS